MNDVPVKEHLEKLLEARIATVEARLDGMDKALMLATETLKERFHQINDLRREVTDDRVNYARKDITKIIAAIYALLILGMGVLAVVK